MTLAAVAISISADRVAKATMPPPKPGAAAEPKSAHLAGFPQRLYKWSVPADNAQTPDKIALGKTLFFDPRLSVDNTVACANCHHSDKAHRSTADRDGRAWQVRQTRRAQRDRCAIQYRGFWDGRERTLEDQAKDPIVNPIEMGMPDHDTVVKKLASITEYNNEFQQVFGGPPIYDNMVKPIAVYELTHLAFDARFDHFMAGDDKALTAQHG